MKKTYVLLSILSLIVIGYSCKKNVSKSAGTVELDLPSTPYTYSAMSFNSDPTINNKATLGRVLFYDSHLSINNAISCASCHKQAYGFADNAAFSVGYEGRLTYRNSKNIANLEGNDNSGVIPPFTTLSSNQGLPLFWDGRENILTNLVARPITPAAARWTSSLLQARRQAFHHWSMRVTLCLPLNIIAIIATTFSPVLTLCWILKT